MLSALVIAAYFHSASKPNEERIPVVVMLEKQVKEMNRVPISLYCYLVQTINAQSN